jgi:hypothetical protein
MGNLLHEQFEKNPGLINLLKAFGNGLKSQGIKSILYE